jgi:peptide chain release factor 3
MDDQQPLAHPSTNATHDATTTDAQRIADALTRRRTFGIISHPDAGKTTMTERLLLLGGAIQMAGTVKARKSSKYATSDWMQMERERGISVTTSVMRFAFQGFEVNLLDTPGHNDFSEDTYRTLTAVDSALMLIDSAKGVETQTIKLMEVCRMRSTPIVTFMNKLDREGLDPFELLENVEKILNIKCIPLTWPIGMGKSFRGVYDIPNRRVQLFDPASDGGLGGFVDIDALDDGRLDDLIGPSAGDKLREDLDLVMGAGDPFDQAAFLRGEQSPVFFGSALSGFGVEEMLSTFVQVTPPPGPRAARERLVLPDDPKMTGFVFKIQANMDPKHRDRIAFMRVCSGRFERGMSLLHVRAGREMKISNPVIFMANERQILEEAYAGDIIGLHDYGAIEIGDTFTEGEPLHFVGVPSFAPEIFRRVHLENPLKMKNLKKGLEQLAQEGAVQLFYPQETTDYIVGVVGKLQLDVLQSRLNHEYGVQGRFDGTEFTRARWYRCDNPTLLAQFERELSRFIARDVKRRPVFLAESNWRIDHTLQKFPAIQFATTSEGVQPVES